MPYSMTLPPGRGIYGKAVGTVPHQEVRIKPWDVPPVELATFPKLVEDYIFVGPERAVYDPPSTFMYALTYVAIPRDENLVLWEPTVPRPDFLVGRKRVFGKE